MKKMGVICVLGLVCFTLLNPGCQNSSGTLSDNEAEGLALAEKHCQSCHQLPLPNHLDKNTWLNHVLPKMGDLMGFSTMGQGSYFSKANASMSLADWDKIVLYYYKQAPTEPLPRQKQVVISPELPNVTVQPPLFSIKNPATTAVSIDTATGALLIADGVQQQLFVVKNNRLVDSVATAKGVSNIKKLGNQYWLLSMGVLYPSDDKLGSLAMVDVVSKSTRILIDSLQRPVSATYTDLDLDGKEDVVICEFGNTVGALNWYKNLGNGQYKKNTLRPLPGAIQTAIHDFNSDGLPDIVALMAQADEGVFIYYNQGEGRFKEERLLQFPSSYGSNSLQLVDFNHDGHLDMVTTNGDNGDYPPILKAYHGVRIFFNDGKNHFTQQNFLPVHGVGKAKAVDIDKDGDLDIASIAYFPDYNNLPAESFLLWINNGKNIFKPLTIPQATDGRWIVMDAADINNDGRPDLVLGNANFKLGNVPVAYTSKWSKHTPSYLLLLNGYKN